MAIRQIPGHVLFMFCCFLSSPISLPAIERKTRKCIRRYYSSATVASSLLVLPDLKLFFLLYRPLNKNSSNSCAAATVKFTKLLQIISLPSTDQSPWSIQYPSRPETLQWSQITPSLLAGAFKVEKKMAPLLKTLPPTSSFLSSTVPLSNVYERHETIVQCTTP